MTGGEGGNGSQMIKMWFIIFFIFLKKIVF